jgi:uncharacterized protein DUF6600/FecR-like protein
MSSSRFGLQASLLAAFTSLLAVACFADSQVRIVRLSQVEGAVQVDRNSGQGYEKAFPNLPVTQGAKLRTGADGRAEVEFEDGTTLRITPKTVVEFPELSARDSGARNTEVKIGEGTAYLDFKATKDEEFTLVFGRDKLALAKPVHLRLQMGDTESSLAVFKGKVQVEGPAGSVNVGRDETATFDFLNDDKHTIAGNLEADPYDAWDAQQQNYHKSYAGSSSYSPYSYGMSDLNYYGNYLNVPGYGLSWQPYFTGAGWNPFMDGAWFFYPGFGYTWVSSYPWGWTPYRYGTWMSVPGYGWVWRPGNSWSGWNTLPTVANGPNQFVAPKPPATGNVPVLVGRGPVPTLTTSSSHQLIIHNDTAGLGIARATVRNLGLVSQQVKAEGVASTNVHPAPVGFWVPASPHGPAFGNMGGASRGNGGSGPAAPSSSHTGTTHSGGGAHK